MLSARTPCWLPAFRPETTPEWFSAAPWSSSVMPSLTLLCRRPRRAPRGSLHCSSSFCLTDPITTSVLSSFWSPEVDVLLFLPRSLSGTSGQGTWSWPRLCLAGCSRRPGSSGWGLSPIIRLERPLPLQRTRSPTLWWVWSFSNTCEQSSPWKCYVGCCVFSCFYLNQCETFPRRSTALSLRCCPRAAGFPLTEMIFSLSLWGSIPSSGLISRKMVCCCGYKTNTE